MASTRLPVLLGILLCLLAVYVTLPVWTSLSGDVSRAASNLLASGQNTVSAVQVESDAEGRWFARFDYSYRGEPNPANLTVELKPQANPALKGRSIAAQVPAQRGAHQVRVELQRPMGAAGPVSTAQVLVQLSAAGKIVAAQEVTHRIDWPEVNAWLTERRFVGKTNDELLTQAVRLIDAGTSTSLSQAKEVLERILTKDARYEMGYVELARVAMKTKWGPDGLRQAEAYLNSALQINASSVNAKVLLGYVYLPSSPEMVYQLASGPATLGALDQLVRQGESLELRDNGNWSALSYAISRRDAATALRLIKLGAKTGEKIGADDLPTALLPVIYRDLDMIRALRQAGVDYSKMTHQGMTAIEHARRNGDRELLEVLGQRNMAS